MRLFLFIFSPDIFFSTYSVHESILAQKGALSRELDICPNLPGFALDSLDEGHENLSPKP
jgi:hypothetical protein